MDSLRIRPCQRTLWLGIAVLGALCAPRPSHADAIVDWDRIATAAAKSALSERECAIVDLAMFDAVNSIEHKYAPYLARERGYEHASPSAAAASAAANALARLFPDRASELKSQLDDYVKGLPGPQDARTQGVQLGEHIAARMVAAREDDGASAPDRYRPRTRPGVYIPTALTDGSMWPHMHPFALERPDQFRPGPPVSLDSDEWTQDYNEVKAYGARNSTLRSPEQTEVARFWLMRGPGAYHPLAWQIVTGRHLSLIDSAHFMALYSVTLSDALIAVLDAKYHYEFWRPITAIRNGDIDGNTKTDGELSWQPLDSTPSHPEYPCAHCVSSGAVAALINATGGLGELHELSLTSLSAPGVTHRWSKLEDFTAEVANARIWAGFHYRFSTEVGTALGSNVATYVAAHFAPAEDQVPRRSR